MGSKAYVVVVFDVKIQFVSVPLRVFKFKMAIRKSFLGLLLNKSCDDHRPDSFAKAACRKKYSMGVGWWVSSNGAVCVRPV